MGRRRRNSESLFDIAVSSSRPVSATIAVAILVLGLVVFPFFARGNPFLLAMAQGIKPAVLIAAGLFGIVSLIKFIADKVRNPHLQVRERRPHSLRRSTVRWENDHAVRHRHTTRTRYRE